MGANFLLIATLYWLKAERTREVLFRSDHSAAISRDRVREYDVLFSSLYTVSKQNIKRQPNPFGRIRKFKILARRDLSRRGPEYI